MNNNNEVCCPEFKPDLWDGKTLNWDNKKFIKESIPTFFHIPFFPLIGKKITKLWKAASDAGAVLINKEEILILFHDPTPFKSEIYLSVDKNVQDMDNIKVSGIFVSKVYDGGYNAVPKFMKEMDSYLAHSGKKAKDYYVHYAYCPKCMKKYGHNYMIFIARVE